MGKRRAYLHVGLDDGSGDVLTDALSTHAHALLDLHVRRAHEPGATFRAVLDVLDAYDDWGYDRAEVEGAWAELVDRSRRGRDTIVLSQAVLAHAGAGAARRVVDSLDGFDVHAVLTARPPDPWCAAGRPGRDLGEVLPTWAGAVGAADHVHVLLGDPAATWRALGRVAGFGTASLRVTAPTALTGPVDPHLAAAWRDLLGASSYDVVGDPEVLGTGRPADDLLAETSRALAIAQREADRLRHRNADLTDRLATAERKRRKLKRRLAERA